MNYYCLTLKDIAKSIKNIKSKFNTARSWWKYSKETNTQLNSVV